MIGLSVSLLVRPSFLTRWNGSAILSTQEWLWQSVRLIVKQWSALI
jgi:hypothetical protein